MLLRKTCQKCFFKFSDQPVAPRTRICSQSWPITLTTIILMMLMLSPLKRLVDNLTLMCQSVSNDKLMNFNSVACLILNYNDRNHVFHATRLNSAPSFILQCEF